MTARLAQTRKETQSIVASSIAYYGTYSIDENTKVMVVSLGASTYANIAAIPNQKRTITLLGIGTLDSVRYGIERRREQADNYRRDSGAG
ncbi:MULTISPECIES: hypothetical protein [unclassified Bradyrhizobium]|uniref:hypothetical protein n=1 Tax=unclassified Bradyrhizobium TaxID=2631580 RepID=UPI001FFA7565|nr:MULTISPECIES: hypothetical protein [unclassified Bradyrhizobium]MCK1710509.1 hypothetical protein [Bradyrhizobium sp. 143]MCK1726481.1 hypothetical protein [Bradyrhizobium sp. 142]